MPPTPQFGNRSIDEKTPVLGLGMPMDHLMIEIFARLIRAESGDESECVCKP